MRLAALTASMVFAVTMAAVPNYITPKPLMQPIAFSGGEHIKVERNRITNIPGSNRYKIAGLIGQWEFVASDGEMVVMRAWRPRIRGRLATAGAEA